MNRAYWLLPVMAAAVAAPCQAGVYGSLANFDVVNNTGSTAHGFEIDIDGIRSTDITSLFGAGARWPNMERYGAPSVSATGTGVKIVYQATYNGAWSAGTPSGTLPVNPSDSCWPLGAPSYGPNYPCDHFGVSTSVATPNVTYKWLVESSPGASTLTPVPATVPNPQFTVTPVPPVNNIPQPPQVNVLIVAPAPQAYEFGEPRWVKVTATGTVADVAVEDLVAENAVIKKANTQTQIEWQLLQVDSGAPGSGQIDLTGVALDAGATGVVYRFEFYQYTGQRDPQTNEALPGPNGNTPGVQGPSAGDLGKFVVAQNAGVNFDGKVPPAPPLPAAPAINATIVGGTLGAPYSAVISATPGVAGDKLAYAVTGLPAGLSFNATTHTIGGTPTVVGTFPLTVTVTDLTNRMSSTGNTSIQIADSLIVFTPTPIVLPNGLVGAPYSYTFKSKGGFAPIKYSLSGTLPKGLAFSGAALSGTPKAGGTYPLWVQAIDALGYSRSASTTLNVSVPGAACQAANQIVSAANATYLDIGGGVANGGQSVSYPKSITFVAPVATVAHGELATYSGSVDKQGFCVATSMTVSAGLSLPTITLTAATHGVTYTSPVIAPAGGVKPYSVSVSGLPAGLTFTGGNITGKATAPGRFTLTISVQDAIKESVSQTAILVVN